MALAEQLETSPAVLVGEPLVALPVGVPLVALAMQLQLASPTSLVGVPLVAVQLELASRQPLVAPVGELGMGLLANCCLLAGRDHLVLFPGQQVDLSLVARSAQFGLWGLAANILVLLAFRLA